MRAPDITRHVIESVSRAPIFELRLNEEDDLMSNAKHLVDGYFTMWNEPNAEERATVIRKVWTDDAISVDPVAQVEGHAAIGDMVSKFQRDYPGHTFALSGDIVEHHNRLRFNWRMLDPKGDVKLSGLDCVRLSADGRIADLAGFFDPTPA